MSDDTRPRRPHTPSGPAQRGALNARIRTVRRRIIGGSLLGTAAFTILAGYQTLSQPAVADAATAADTAITGDVASATATAPFFAAQGGAAVTTPTATTGNTAAGAAATATPTTAVIGAISTPATNAATTGNTAATSTAPTATTVPVPTATTVPKPLSAYQAPTKRGKSSSS